MSHLLLPAAAPLALVPQPCPVATAPALRGRRHLLPEPTRPAFLACHHTKPLIQRIGDLHQVGTVFVCSAHCESSYASPSSGLKHVFHSDHLPSRHLPPLHSPPPLPLPLCRGGDAGGTDGARTAGTGGTSGRIPHRHAAFAYRLIGREEVHPLHVGHVPATKQDRRPTATRQMGTVVTEKFLKRHISDCFRIHFATFSAIWAAHSPWKQVSWPRNFLLSRSCCWASRSARSACICS